MIQMPSSLSVLGATGSVGMQSLDVAKAHHIPVKLLTGGKNASLMAELARQFMPEMIVMADESAAKSLHIALKDTPIRVYGGSDAICQAILQAEADVTINAILGEAGLAPTLAALSASKRLALSNKESLVIAGEIVMAKAKATGCQLIPVDSEHSAIFQCLEGNARADVRSILLTASGGPFFGYTKAQLQSVSLADTLAHPTWKMGKKITVDSATLMNKGFEVIEAVHLFGVDVGQINVVVHRESIIHSAVEYADMSVIAQMALPDMRSCVSYALTYPRRTEGVCAPLDLTSIGTLTFAKPDTDTFPLLRLAKFAIGEGGAVPACVNAANEEAVAAFLSEQIRFCQIAEVVEEAVHATLSEAKSAVALDDILYCASLARDKALQIISNHRSA